MNDENDFTFVQMKISLDISFEVFTEKNNNSLSMRIFTNGMEWLLAIYVWLDEMCIMYYTYTPSKLNQIDLWTQVRQN